MSRQKKRRIALILLVFALIVIAIGNRINSAFKQYDLNHQLVLAVYQKDAGEAARLVEAGADPNSSMLGWDQVPYLQRLRRVFARRTVEHGEEVTAFLAACGGNPIYAASAAMWADGTAERRDNWPSDLLVKTMIDHGAAVHERTGYYAVGCAETVRNGEIVELLAKSGVDLNRLDSDNHSALMLAMAHSDVPMITRLVRLGAKVNQQDSAGYTALTIWMQNTPTTPAVEALLEAGADPNIRTAGGYDALNLCHPEVNHDLAELLLKHGARKSAPDPTPGAPPIASLLGIVVGQDDLISTGKKMSSIQPPGASALPATPMQEFAPQNQAWSSLTPGGQASVSTIDWASKQRTILSLNWLSDPIGSRSSPPPAAVAELCWMKCIRPGMTKSEVEAAIANRLPPPERQGIQWQWYMAGNLRPLPTDAYVFNNWIATLTFSGEVLDQITIQAGTGLARSAN